MLPRQISSINQAALYPEKTTVRNVNPELLAASSSFNPAMGRNKLPLGAILRGTARAPSIVSRATYRYVKRTLTTPPPDRDSRHYYADYEKYKSGDTDDVVDYDSDNDDYKENETSDDTSMLSSDDRIEPAKRYTGARRAAGNPLRPVRTIESAAIRPGPVATHPSYLYLPAPLARTPPFSTTTTTQSTTTITPGPTSATVTTVHFEPMPINIPSEEWNKSTRDTHLSIHHQNYTVSIGADTRQSIRSSLLQQLKCFQYIPNRRLRGYEQETIKPIGLQDCLYNCILRVTFLCLSVNYDPHTKACLFTEVIYFTLFSFSMKLFNMLSFMRILCVFARMQVPKRMCVCLCVRTFCHLLSTRKSEKLEIETSGVVPTTCEISHFNVIIRISLCPTYECLKKRADF
ncbi:unnamed protein product [Gongylonema pulchrum]|uniref:Apple domain-containing protein n=1 Tax=Gongylonema pulchrum TaxID=637853 RepID=A0A183CVQ5_9BILA|nr:unnamed protein product [Gongylonema pulchrum]